MDHELIGRLLETVSVYWKAIGKNQQPILTLSQTTTWIMNVFILTDQFVGLQQDRNNGTVLVRCFLKDVNKGVTEGLVLI